MSNDQNKKDRPDDGEEPRSKRSFIEHLLNQPEGPDTPRAQVVLRNVEF